MNTTDYEVNGIIVTVDESNKNAIASRIKILQQRLLNCLKENKND